MFVTLRRAGLFDPVQFFRDGLIQIKSISVNLAKVINIDHASRGKPFHNAALLRRRATKRNVSMPVDLLRLQR
jgi:hypothetical protein